MDSLIMGIDNILSDIISVLPNSPFTSYITASTNSDIADVLSWVNLFVPVAQMIAVGELWLVGITGYYIISVAMRWVKAVG